MRAGSYNYTNNYCNYPKTPLPTLATRCCFQSNSQCRIRSPPPAALRLHRSTFPGKKIGDVPEERRHRLLQSLNPRLISRAWEIAGTRYDDPKLVKKSASNLLSNKDGEIPSEFYNCRTSGGPLPIAWINIFKKTIFCGSNGKTYGRFIGGSIVAQFANRFSPLYFEVTQLKEVMSTEQPCDFAYEFGDGLLDLHECPAGFPRPVKHPYPFSDQVVIYIRHIGPGVLVGQAWQEGKKLDQVPRKLCGEILMVKDYAATIEII
ncbi:WD repeat-containing protein 49 isoform 3 [Theobroma cacao]|uniref:WD repeat-containing protein 49 isoform 3 n=1 Tax=Theobroma cacao TaxID=3641 RepID=A0A061G798_THECC|nr:WD repeat-containing protein 49 isoform 3 [Theobroma cacao]